MFINDANDHPADGTFVVLHGFASGHAIGRNDHTLVHRGAVGVNGDLRNAFRRASMVNGLTNDQAPALKTRVLAGGGEIAFNAG